ncbi:restriction endonuclease subunit S [uncultured Methanobrevibacter sp.]|uniref:restriction endonuclease subunit S n=1 Tax=uncultured Methanobrevibacter sp. TaxID=253161 RepID=UPI002590BBBA|nr:restriction endonuclease subunit S [uncultured Methanobrevibacter sp.]
MSLEWKYEKLGKLCSFDKEGVNPKEDIKYYHYSFPAFDNNKEPEVEVGKDIKSSKFLFNKGDILFNKLNVKFKRVWDIDFDIDENSICSTEFIPIQAKNIDRNFLYYCLISPNFTNEMKYLSTGTSNSHQRINPKDIKDYDLFLPTDEEIQKKIGYILKLLDKKISMNVEINKNLQKQINILFKSFFINFEFYDGKYQETLFGKIPIEWNIILFKDILNERNEKSTNQDIPMYSVTLDGIQPRADIYKKKITAKTTKFKIIHKYDLIFGMPNSGYQYGIMYDEIGGVSSAYPVFEINGIQPRYVDLFIKNLSNYFNDIVKSGSRMGQGIDKKVLLSKEIYVPPNEHLDKYYSIESKLLDLINHNLTEINNLTKLRDTLLPKLMSGEIDVSKINCDLELKYNYMKYLFNQIHKQLSKSVV